MLENKYRRSITINVTFRVSSQPDINGSKIYYADLLNKDGVTMASYMGSTEEKAISHLMDFLGIEE
jgi:hypothetical protein